MKQWFLPGLLLVFALFSIVTLTSIAPDNAGRQLIFFLAGGLIFFAMAKLPYHYWIDYRVVVYAAACLLLIVPLFLDPTRGTARWISVGDWFGIQPSQLAIPLVSFVLIDQVTRGKNTYSSITKFFLWLIPPAILIMIEPDLGTTLVYLIVLASLLFLTKTSWRVILSLFGACLVIVAVGWFFVLQPYQKARITSFVSNQAEQSDANYNARQALIAVGSGQITGRGLGQGIQSHLQFLPEKHTDFIFASLAEEYGFIGSIVVFSMLGILIGYLLWMSQQTSDPTSQLFLIITGLLFFIQASVNINMNIGLLPITGLTLPFISYGGSSILSLMFILGICQNMINQSKSTPGLHIR